MTTTQTQTTQPMSPPVSLRSGPWPSAPRVPISTRWPPADLVAGLCGDTLAEPIRALEAAHQRAEEAVQDLLAHRPGPRGSAWREAERSDAEQAASGETPEVWATQRLLGEDPARWAAASAAVGAIGVVRHHVDSVLDRHRIAATAMGVAAARTNEWVKVAQAGWEGRADPAVGWQHYRAGQGLLAEYRTARRVEKWANSSLGWSSPDTEAAHQERPPHYEWLPEDREGRGHWLGLELLLTQPTWLRLPDPVAVKWPADIGELVTAALPESGLRYLNLHGAGVHSVDK